VISASVIENNNCSLPGRHGSFNISLQSISWSKHSGPKAA